MIVGLTGGIGSGKSMVAKLFGMLGCCVFNSDLVAKELYFDVFIRMNIINLLGQEAYLSESEINKLHISSKIFNEPAILLKLNAIIHPAVLNRFEDFKKNNVGKIIIKETALLFETQQQSQMDKVIMVAAKNELRTKRVMKRDQLSKEEVIKKMNAQLSQEEKINHSDFVIYNSEEEFLITQVLTIYNQLKHA